MRDQAQTLTEIIDALEPARAKCDAMWNAAGLDGDVACQLIRVEKEIKIAQAMASITISALGETKPCADCGTATAADDLTVDDRCEACVDACACSGCKDTFPGDDLTDVDGDELCAACVEARADDGHCSTCAGTGIGQGGDPDTSSCHACSGGVRRAERDPYEAFDRRRDQQREA